MASRTGSGNPRRGEIRAIQFKNLIPRGLRSPAPSLAWLVAAASGLVLAVSPGPAGLVVTSPVLRPYVPDSGHKAYGFSLAAGTLARSAAQQTWVDEADQAILEPALVTTPFETAFGFDPAAPSAAGFRFSAESGKRIQVEVHLEEGEDIPAVFVDLFRLQGEFPEYVASTAAAPAAGPAQRVHRLALDLLEDDDYVLRVQPPLGSAGRYRLAIRSRPILEFPVSGLDTGAILSGFGAARDGGARQHHGVDIFARRGTPVLASLDAYVSRVETTNLGGNVVWLQPLFSRMRLYYAHLDTQSVEPGQYVSAGDLIGTVGNTGNARTTPPHLHFGVYVRGRGGARDPEPFLQ